MDLELKKNWVALLSIAGIGKKTFRNCLAVLKNKEISWKDFWVNKANIWSICKLNKKQQASIKVFTKAYSVYSFWDKLCLQGISVVTYLDDKYPVLLRNLSDKPAILFIKGPMDWGEIPIAIVGTRRMTSYGELVTKKITQELADQGASIISGFMYGVDVCAQKQALLNQAKTVGVLGFGFDYMYPVSQKKLFDHMLSRGATFITEHSPYIYPATFNFPMRNRIIAGLSLGVVVTEAAEKSGSLITANWTLEYGRQIFAVPGPITNKYCEGTRQLINQGASLVTSGEEIIQLLKDDWRIVNCQALNKIFNHKKISALEKRIINLLTSQQLSTNNLAKKLKKSIAEMNTQLNLMEINGLISRVGESWLLKN
jgi:DNA processing protein